jgi:hypothetical protein
MKRARTFIALLLPMLMACSARPELASENADVVEKEAIAGNSEVASSTSEQSVAEPLHLIKTADYRFQVVDIKTSIRNLEQFAKKHQAFIAESQLTQQSNVLENTMTLRVPAAAFDALLADIDKEATQVIYRNIKTSDVSKEFVDIEARLRTKREVKLRYEEILRKRTGTIKEVLEAEQQIGAIQEEIEAAVSRIKYLQGQVSFSTIHLSFYQPTPDAVLVDDDEKLSARFGHAWHGGLNGVINVAIGLTYLWPWILITGGGLWAWRYLRKRRSVAAPPL